MHFHSCLPKLSVSLEKIAQRSSQPAQVDHLRGASSAFRDLQEICKVCSLDPKWLWSENARLIHISGVRDCQGQWEGPSKPLLLSGNCLCSFGNCFWAYRIIATLIWAPCPDHHTIERCRESAISLCFFCVGFFFPLWKASDISLSRQFLGSLSCLTCIVNVGRSRESLTLVSVPKLC